MISPRPAGRAADETLQLVTKSVRLLCRNREEVEWSLDVAMSSGFLRSILNEDDVRGCPITGTSDLFSDSLKNLARLQMVLDCLGHANQSFFTDVSRESILNEENVHGHGNQNAKSALW